ncbi:CGNR zinc finger domain-containing protein [Litchfieldella rifensis]|uniref:CGNR zinc finger domain-containing protein n=1 Tax=Litchfieldella rifensis TaxID=762643 RepID=A0ABV7LTZ0_9GAMM
MTRHRWTEHDFIAGDPCLDFLNTVGDTGKSRVIDRLEDRQALGDWIRASNLTDAGSTPQVSERDFDEAIALRERLHTLFSTIAQGHATTDAWEMVRDSLAEAVAFSKLAIDEPTPLQVTSHRFRDRMALAALALLYSGRLHRLKECGRCSWLFLDQSKAQRRRWCRTEVCGNRARVERHYHRNH